MRDKFLALDSALHDYVVRLGARQDELLARLERETEAMGGIAVMQIAPDQGAFMTLVVRAIAARRALEVGTFTGYGAVCIARGLAEGGRLTCCEIDPGYAETARRNLAEAGLADRAEVVVGPALETLRALPREEPIDFAFLDADKTGYRDYYEEVLGLLRPGGLMLLDNVLLSGRVLDPQPDDDSARAIAELNQAIAADERVDCAMLAVADGLTLVRKR